MEEEVERETETETKRQRERERQRQTETETQRDRETERERIYKIGSWILTFSYQLHRVNSGQIPHSKFYTSSKGKSSNHKQKAGSQVRNNPINSKCNQIKNSQN